MSFISYILVHSGRVADTDSRPNLRTISKVGVSSRETARPSNLLSEGFPLARSLRLAYPLADPLRGQQSTVLCLM